MAYAVSKKGMVHRNVTFSHLGNVHLEVAFF
jgi:hypothetical protein